MSKRGRLLLITVSVLVASLGVAFVALSQAQEAAPAETRTFSWVVEFTGDIDADLQRFADMLRGRGYSEAEVRRELGHLRPALESSKYGAVETRTFSVEVQAGDMEAYLRALREQGVSEETIRALEAEVRSRWGSMLEGISTSGGCKTRTDGAEAYNAFGQLLYRYSSSIYWCYDGSSITSLNTWESYSTYWGWQFLGSTKSESGGLGQWSYILHRYATMYNPYIRSYAYPDTHQGVYGDGSSWGYANP